VSERASEPSDTATPARGPAERQPEGSASAPEAEEIGELIEDCAAIPPALRTGHAELPRPRAAAPWTVSESCLAAVQELDEYV
jgi:hypothetical protein